MKSAALYVLPTMGVVPTLFTIPMVVHSILLGQPQSALENTGGVAENCHVWRQPSTIAPTMQTLSRRATEKLGTTSTKDTSTKPTPLSSNAVNVLGAVVGPVITWVLMIAKSFV
jgi:hypothetical protein